ncbi:MAG: TolC family protein [Phycisphaerales bacterium]|nr:TolC family protein [Phycisphaerales bacterium]
MNWKFCIYPAIGAAFVAGCAGPLDQRWDDPIYRSLQDQYKEVDRETSNSPDRESANSFIEIESLDALSIEEAIRIAIYHSPRLRSAGYRIDAASGRVLQAGLYPNPSFNFGAEALGSDAGSGGESIYVIEQEIVLGGKLDRARDVAESDRLAARAEFIAEEFSVATGVTRAYFSAVSAKERLNKRQELAALASQLLEAAAAKVDAGSATEPDRLRAEVVFEQAQIELDSARFAAKASQMELAAVIGLEMPVDLPLTTAVDYFQELPSYEDLLAATLVANSRVSLARIAITRARQAHKLAKAQGVPDLTVSVGPRYSDIDGESTVDLGLGIEIPLFDRNQGEVRATLAERLTASSQLRSVQLELTAEVSNAWSVYQSALSSSSRYRSQLLPKAERTLDLTRQAYQSGKADYLRLLDAQQVVIESRIAYIDTLQQLHAAAALLNELSQSNAPWRNPRDEDQPQAEVNQE